jgi:hypothetical protein
LNQGLTDLCCVLRTAIQTRDAALSQGIPRAWSFAEARYFAWERLAREQIFPIKRHSLSACELLGDAEQAASFEGGPVIVARLAPVDYHHLHYPDDGETFHHKRLGRRLWTVNRTHCKASLTSCSGTSGRRRFSVQGTSAVLGLLKLARSRWAVLSRRIR